ncbi:hypothetical protein OBP_066 [Pseudomonas phage OBP]|uniref:hypothetical protein n=1 Tax=Pseudomonas phage OBP TaxID=1124849 RepID=UPI000240D420|nr:hypothetical protein OBP_066 [Pseudomonas phage OBP]AEV89503.1 hypothetical protein OBP_066 [Pseudomonas phage OBP]
MIVRTKGTLPISVGTALAIETLPSVKMYKYHAILFNLRTIIRNARQAFEGDVLPSVSELFDACKEDIVGIAEAIIAMKIRTVLELKIYYPSYRSLESTFPLGKVIDVQKNGTDKQKAIYKLDKEVADKVLAEFGKGITQVDSRVPQFSGDALIMTHHPVDLVTTESYSRLYLLESHTGTIKNYTLTYSKLTGSDKFNNIPLNKITIQVFGDKSSNFYSQSIGLKNTLKQLADSAHWSTASTPSMVARSIRSLPESPEKDILIQMSK